MYFAGVGAVGRGSNERLTCPPILTKIFPVMNTTQTQINHLIKTLAEQLRKADEAGLVTNKNGTVGASKEKAAACKAASKAVAGLEKLGVNYNTAYDKAEALNEAIAA